MCDLLHLTKQNKSRLPLLAAVVAMMVAFPAHAITYQAMGTLHDGNTWTATAVFAESAMDNNVINRIEFSNVVSNDEMISFEVVTTFSNSREIFYDLSTALIPDKHGFQFDGNTADANLIGPIPSPARYFQALGVDPSIGRTTRLTLTDHNAANELFIANQPNTLDSERFGITYPNGIPASAWVRIDDNPNPDGGAGNNGGDNGNNNNNNAVPEPVTATLGLMGLGVLGMATRRRMG